MSVSKLCRAVLIEAGMKSALVKLTKEPKSVLPRSICCMHIKQMIIVYCHVDNHVTSAHHIIEVYMAVYTHAGVSTYFYCNTI